MTILVTGATGSIGRHLVQELARRGADARALVRDPSKAQLPDGIDVVQGDLLEVESLRRAFTGVTTLFLLNAVAADEFTQALVTLNVAREAGVKRIVYLSVIEGEAYINVPHFSGKAFIEQVIAQMGFGGTILRPVYFMSNDLAVHDVISARGVYPMPVGGKGLAMVDVRDIAEIAAIELIRHEQAGDTPPLARLNIVGPDTLTGTAIAAIWSDALGKPVAYAGDDTAAFEQNLKAFMPGWMAYDMRLMSAHFQTTGMLPQAGDREKLIKMLGRPLRSYRAFALENFA